MDTSMLIAVGIGAALVTVTLYCFDRLMTPVLRWFVNLVREGGRHTQNALVARAQYIACIDFMRRSSDGPYRSGTKSVECMEEAYQAARYSYEQAARALWAFARAFAGASMPFIISVGIDEIMLHGLSACSKLMLILAVAWAPLRVLGDIRKYNR